MIEYLSSGKKYSIKELSNLLEVSPRMIRVYKDEIEKAGIYIENYPNIPDYPGAFVKRSGISENIDELLETMKDVENRNCKFVDCLTFYDGKELYTFFGVSKGTLAYQKKGLKRENKLSNLWYVFIPNNHTKTLAEMTDKERENRKDGHTSASELFLKWYNKKYTKENRRSYEKQRTRKRNRKY